MPALAALDGISRLEHAVMPTLCSGAQKAGKDAERRGGKNEMQCSKKGSECDVRERGDKGGPVRILQRTADSLLGD